METSPGFSRDLAKPWKVGKNKAQYKGPVQIGKPTIFVDSSAMSPGHVGQIQGADEVCPKLGTEVAGAEEPWGGDVPCSPWEVALRQVIEDHGQGNAGAVNTLEIRGWAHVAAEEGLR